MTAGERATTFVTEADGFMGTELVNVLVAQGHQVFALTKSLDAAERVRRAGATAVMGDLLKPGQWQDETARGVPPSTSSVGRRGVSRKRAAAITRDRVVMDANLLDAVPPVPRSGLSTSQTRALRPDRLPLDHGR
jgi:nucleoside-diphosphate-sugar epimerase